MLVHLQVVLKEQHPILAAFKRFFEADCDPKLRGKSSSQESIQQESGTEELKVSIPKVRLCGRGVIFEADCDLKIRGESSSQVVVQEELGAEEL